MRPAAQLKKVVEGVFERLADRNPAGTVVRLSTGFGGERALKTLGRADDPEASPKERRLQQVLPQGPVLLLLDELAIYVAKPSDRGQGNLLGFVNSLAAVACSRPQTVLVVTDPAGQVAYAAQSAQLAAGLNAAAARLDDVLGRRASDFDPVGDKSARVIVRRLFQSLDPVEAEAVSARYFDLYRRVKREWPAHLEVLSIGV